MNTIRANDGGELLNADQFYYTKDGSGSRTLNVNLPAYKEVVGQYTGELLKYNMPESNSLKEDSVAVLDLDIRNYPLETVVDGFENFVEGQTYHVEGIAVDDNYQKESFSEDFEAFVVTSDMYWYDSYFIGKVVVGNYDDNHAGFYVVKLDNGFSYFTANNRAHVQSVSGSIDLYNIKKLDVDLLPEEAALKDEIPHPDWEADIESVNFIANRPWGYTRYFDPNIIYNFYGENYLIGSPETEFWTKNTNDIWTANVPNRLCSPKDMLGEILTVRYTSSTGNVDGQAIVKYGNSLGYYIGNPGVLRADADDGSGLEFLAVYNLGMNQWMKYLPSTANMDKFGSKYTGTLYAYLDKPYTLVTKPYIPNGVEIVYPQQGDASDVLAANVGSVLRLYHQNQTKIDSLPPAFTEADNGKILGIVDGALAWVDKA